MDEYEILKMEKKLEGKKFLEYPLKRSRVDKLGHVIAQLFALGKINMKNEILLTNIRHRNLLGKSILSIDNALNAQNQGMPVEFIAMDIKEAADYLGQITGESVSEDIIHEIFSRFCLGK